MRANRVVYIPRRQTRTNRRIRMRGLPRKRHFFRVLTPPDPRSRPSQTAKSPTEKSVGFLFLPPVATSDVAIGSGAPRHVPLRGSIGDAQVVVTFGYPGWQRRDEGALRERSDADPAKAHAAVRHLIGIRIHYQSIPIEQLHVIVIFIQRRRTHPDMPNIAQEIRISIMLLFA
jgi:hypothetical protein